MKTNVTINGVNTEVEMTALALIARPTGELLEIYNELNPDNILKAWRSAKTKLVAKLMEDYAEDAKPAKPVKKAAKKAPAEKAVKAKKEKAPKEPKERRPSKSAQMLANLQDNGPTSLDDLVTLLSTSAASIRCYVSYFKTGAKGHEVTPIYIAGGMVQLGDKPEKVVEEKPAKPAKPAKKASAKKVPAKRAAK